MDIIELISKTLRFQMRIMPEILIVTTSMLIINFVINYLLMIHINHFLAFTNVLKLIPIVVLVSMFSYFDIHKEIGDKEQITKLIPPVISYMLVFILYYSLIALVGCQYFLC